MSIDPYVEHLLLELKFKGVPIFKHCRYRKHKNNVPYIPLRRKQGTLDPIKIYTIVAIPENEHEHENEQNGQGKNWT